MIDNNEQKKEEVRDNQVEKIDNKANELVDAGDKKEKEKGKGTFYGILAFAVFIIMAVGATFAYFTASTNSANGSVRTGSTTLSLEFISYESAWLSDKLVPAYTNVVEYSVEKSPEEKSDGKNRRICVDDQDREICSLYVFQVKNNDSGSIGVKISLESQENGFFDEQNGGPSQLYAMLYKVEAGGDAYNVAPDFAPDPVFITDENTGVGAVCDSSNENNGCVQVTDGSNNPITTGFTPVYVNRKGVTKTLEKVTDSVEEGGETVTKVVPSINRQVPLSNEEAVKLNDSVTIPGEGYVTFMIVLYLKDNGLNQNYATNKSFSGTVRVEGLDSTDGGITGRINGLEKTPNDYTGLQSDSSESEPETP